MTYGFRVIIIAGNGPYFSHYFQFLYWKTQNPVSTTYGFRVLCLIHSCGVITQCRVKQVYPLIKLHLWCPRFKKNGHLRCSRGICHLFWWLFFLSLMTWMPSCDFDLSGYFYICTRMWTISLIWIIWFTVLDADDQSPLSNIWSEEIDKHSLMLCHEWRNHSCLCDMILDLPEVDDLSFMVWYWITWVDTSLNLMAVFHDCVLTNHKRMGWMISVLLIRNWLILPHRIAP